ncbi:hypothetical protein B0T21DRAFT_295049 [Apiosordaria backusii]|uniref:Uncharacterized protein n=1 Tax=Apiosordaria backusii TaxID=314023 RepID=A0AA40ASZ4_9PEZI|nr:hypothetical protein B0T21DRAFT_295049 [Apiosordaria backusii]
MPAKEIFHWPSIKPKLLTPEGRLIFEDSIYPDIAWDVLAEAAKRHHLQDMHDDAWKHLQTAKDIRDNGPGGYDGEMQFAFFFVLAAMIKVQLKVQERNIAAGGNGNGKGDKSPGGMSTLSEGESMEFGE